MSDRRLPLGPNSKISASGRRTAVHPPLRRSAGHNKSNPVEEVDDLDSEDPALLLYQRPKMPRFKGPTKAQLTARQFNPRSGVPLSKDEQWRNWEADQIRLEREHNQRREVLLRERDLQRGQQAVEEEEEDLEMEEEQENRFPYLPPRRHFTPEPFHDEMLEGDIHDLAPASKRRKLGRERQKSSHASEMLRGPRGNPSPLRRRNRQENEWHPPQNRFRYRAGETYGSSPPQPPQPPRPESGYQPSHPGSMRPWLLQTNSGIPTRFSPPRPRPRSRLPEMPIPRPRQTTEPASPGLFVDQSPPPPVPQGEEDSSMAAVKEEEPEEDFYDKSVLSNPISSSPVRGTQPATGEEEDTGDGQTTNPGDLPYLPFKDVVFAPLEALLGAEVGDMEVVSNGESKKTLPVTEVFRKIEGYTKRAVTQGSLDEIAVVQKKGLIDLKQGYRQATAKVEKQEEELADKDREIDRLKEIIQRKRRDPEEDWEE
ncbi:hypothetical protein ONS95_014567 [Cadophora gregata]|uniref:uncharacterized protein n=1 Tax=Cadophora gregata TaxID=51156 RepID=UPI0026DADFF7|nr:uncharacterized protein ONS95_014567 [Cadophora gregata]KAK0112841.1 hypothetical protein ONS95_014567 [Cadophora gregata]KAK0124910.1 hypothetical protein ONS96_008787 [Cadophora gregata f. sp. sojae]